MAPWLDIREMKSKLLRMHYYDKTTLRRRLQRLAAKLLRPMRNPLFGELPPLEKGPNWFALTAPARDWALDYLDAHPRYTEAFRHSRCGDEIFFHTLLLASPFARRCCRHAPLIYTEWPADTASAHPLLLSDETVDRLRAVRDGDDAPLFARKIDERIDLGRYARLLLGGN